MEQFLGEQDILLAIPCCNNGGKTWAERQVARDATFKATLKGETLDARWNCAQQRKRVNICDSKRVHYAWPSNKITSPRFTGIDRAIVDCLPFRNGTRYRHSRKQLIVHRHVGGWNEFVFKKKEIGLGRSLLKLGHVMRSTSTRNKRLIS